jgi:hypothetical protein
LSSFLKAPSVGNIVLATRSQIEELATPRNIALRNNIKRHERCRLDIYASSLHVEAESKRMDLASLPKRTVGVQASRFIGSTDIPTVAVPEP